MGWDGNGNVIRDNGTNTGQTVWQDDADASVRIRADRHDNHDQDLADAIENAVALDGQNTTTTGNSILRFDSGSSRFSGVPVGTNEILARKSGNLIGVGVAASRLVGRKSTGDLGELTPAEGRTVLQVADAISPVSVTDGGTDAFTGDFGRDVSADETVRGDFGSANTTTTPTLENTGGTPAAQTITTKDGSALWSGALSGVHTLQLASGGGSWLVLDPNRAVLDEDDMASDSASGVPTQQSVAAYVGHRLPFVSETRKTNLLPRGSFIRGYDGWSIRTSNDTGGIVFTGQAVSAWTAPEQWFANTIVQLNTDANGDFREVVTPKGFPVDTSKSYIVGLWGSWNGGTGGDIDLIVDQLDENGSLIGGATLTSTETLPADADGTSGEVNFQINPTGGASPAWDSNAVSARCRFGYTNSSGAVEDPYIVMVYAIREEEWPGAYGTSKSNNGGGTHEAWWDGTHLYTVGHSYNEIAKFDSGLIRQDVLAVNDYPHDIVGLGSDLWIVNQHGASIQQINPGTMSVTNTYAIDSSREGFGIGTDGTSLWIGVGNSGSAETPEILAVNTSDGAQTSLSTDVDGGSANIPVKHIDGSVWSIHRSNGEVKRINPSTGSTEATISAGVGKLYGLGVGGSKVFANGLLGVAQIDPDTNAVEATYLYREDSFGQSNVHVKDGLAYACGMFGVMVIDYAAQRSREIILDGGAVKWAHTLGDHDVAVGTYGAPWLHVLSPR